MKAHVLEPPQFRLNSGLQNPHVHSKLCAIPKSKKTEIREPPKLLNINLFLPLCSHASRYDDDEGRSASEFMGEEVRLDNFLHISFSQRKKATLYYVRNIGLRAV